MVSAVVDCPLKNNDQIEKEYKKNNTVSMQKFTTIGMVCRRLFTRTQTGITNSLLGHSSRLATV